MNRMYLGLRQWMIIYPFLYIPLFHLIAWEILCCHFFLLTQCIERKEHNYNANVLVQNKKAWVTAALFLMWLHDNFVHQVGTLKVSTNPDFKVLLLTMSLDIQLTSFHIQKWRCFPASEHNPILSQGVTPTLWHTFKSILNFEEYTILDHNQLQEV